MKKIDKCTAAGIVAAVILGVSLAGNAWHIKENRELRSSLQMQRQREMSDIADSMADIEVNLQKLLIATGAQQSVTLLGETALLAQNVESGLSRLPLQMDTAADAMRFAGQMGQYTMTLAAQVSGGGMLSTDDERQLGELLQACRELNSYLARSGEAIYAAPAQEYAAIWPDGEQESTAIDYPALIYDGPFSDGKMSGAPKGLTGERITREQAREIAARAAGTAIDRVKDAADSGGEFEAFGFIAQTDHGSTNVQITGQGGHLLWMMPEQAEYAERRSREECLQNAQNWLNEQGFGRMEPCFVQQYDGMVVANFASIQDGVLLYPDQVKVQVSMDSGTVVGVECTQYLTNHTQRVDLEPKVSEEEAREMLSGKLSVSRSLLCVIPINESEKLCWGFEGTFDGAKYWVYIDAQSGETAEILRVVDTPQGETAM